MRNLNDLTPGTPEYEEAYQEWRASMERLTRQLEEDARQRVQLDREAERMGMSTRDVWLRHRQEEWDRQATAEAVARLGGETAGRVVHPGENASAPVTPAFLASRAETKEWVAPEIKVSQPAGQPFAVLTGYASTFGLPADSYGDVVTRGAFAKSLASKKDKTIKYPLLASHQMDTPIGGILEAHEDIYGLRIKALLDLDTVAGREAYSGIKKGYNSGLSIGYKAVKTHFEGENRFLDEITLYEASVCALPANERAKVLNAELVTED